MILQTLSADDCKTECRPNPRQHATEIREITPAELGWCAGFIDGEGCLSLQRQSGRLSVQFRAVNTERGPIERLREVLGGKVHRHPGRDPGRVDAFCWYCPQRELVGVLEALKPHLVVKRAQADAVLRFLRLGWCDRDEERALELVLTAGSKRRRKPEAST